MGLRCLSGRGHCNVAWVRCQSAARSRQSADKKTNAKGWMGPIGGPGFEPDPPPRARHLLNLNRSPRPTDFGVEASLNWRCGPLRPPFLGQRLVSGSSSISSGGATSGRFSVAVWRWHLRRPTRRKRKCGESNPARCTAKDAQRWWKHYHNLRLAMPSPRSHACPASRLIRSSA